MEFTMEFAGKALPFGQTEINDIVKMLAISETALWTVIEVETSGVGFLPSRQPAILFERHKFSRKTGGITFYPCGTDEGDGKVGFTLPNQFLNFPYYD